MPARTWSDVIPEDRLASARKVERTLASGPDLSIDNPAYADPHAFDRAVVADFVHPKCRTRVNDKVEWFYSHPGGVNLSLWGARGDVIELWAKPPSENPGGDRLGAAAFEYLRARGYPTEHLLAIANQVHALVDGLTVRDGAHLPAHDPDAGFDDLDYALMALLAGLTPPEILAMLAAQAWPDLEVLYLLHALA